MFAPNDQDNRRAGARDLARNQPRALARRLRRAAVGAVCAIAFLLPLQFVGAGAAQASMTFIPLTLVNGWAPAELSTPAVGDINGIVHLKGSIEHGTSPVAFTLPVGFRPAANVYVPVDMCDAARGRLDIAPSGVVSVQAEGGAFSNAQCFTSLDGALFATSASSFTPMSLLNLWTNAPYGTSDAAAANINGIVYLKGAIATPGTEPTAFILPAGMRPSTWVYVPVDLCGATYGHLYITPNGEVTVAPQGGPFSPAWPDVQCFTSLDGASFAL